MKQAVKQCATLCTISEDTCHQAGLMFHCWISSQQGRYLSPNGEENFIHRFNTKNEIIPKTLAFNSHSDGKNRNFPVN